MRIAQLVIGAGFGGIAILFAGLRPALAGELDL